MTRQDRVGTVATSVFHADGYQWCVYHSTPVVKWNDKEIILDTGGWRTATTKNRMNQVSQQFGLDYRVYQKDFCWFVSYEGVDFLFPNNTFRLLR